MNDLLNAYLSLKAAILDDRIEEVSNTCIAILEFCKNKAIPRKFAIDPELYTLGFIDSELASYVVEHVKMIFESYSSGDISSCVDSIDNVCSTLQDSINDIKVALASQR